MYKNDLQQNFPSLEIGELEILDAQSREHEVHTQFALSMIIPTRNEAGNIEPLLARIDQVTRGTAFEVVFVDDSTDDTVIRMLNYLYSVSLIWQS